MDSQLADHDLALRARARERERDRRHRERIVAMEKGVPLPELSPEPDNPSWIASAWTRMQLNPRWPPGAEPCAS